MSDLEPGSFRRLFRTGCRDFQTPVEAHAGKRSRPEAKFALIETFLGVGFVMLPNMRSKKRRFILDKVNGSISLKGGFTVGRHSQWYFNLEEKE